MPAATRVVTPATPTPRSPGETARDELTDVKHQLTEFLGTLGSLQFDQETVEELLAKERGEQAVMIKQIKDVCDKRINTLQKLCDEFHRQADEAEKAAMDQKTEMEKKMSAAHKAHKAELQRVRDEHERVLVQLRIDEKRSMTDALAAKQAIHDNEIRVSTDRIQKLTKEVQDLRADNRSTALAAEVAELRKENVALQAQLADEATKNADKLKSLSDTLEEKSSELLRSVEEVSSLSRRLSESESFNGTMSSEVRQLKAILDREMGRITPSKKRKTAEPVKTAANGAESNGASGASAVSEEDDENEGTPLMSPTTRSKRKITGEELNDGAAVEAMAEE